MKEEEKLLFAGIKESSLEKVATAISRGVNLNKLYEKYKFTPLLYAIKRGNEEIVMVLIENGADLRVKGEKGETPLFLACYMDKYTIAKVLLDYYADPNSPTENGMLPLNAAIRSGNPALVTLLLNEGADVNKNIYQLPLNTAIDFDNHAILELLLNNGANPNIPPAPLSNSPPPLFLAIQKNSLQDVKLLINKGAHLNTTYKYLSVLHYAVMWMETTNILRFLCEKGANVNYQDRIHKNTPLMFAVHYTKIGAVQVLCEFGANKNLVSASGKRAVEYVDSDTNIGNQMLNILQTCGITDPLLPVPSSAPSQNRDRGTDPVLVPLLNEDPQGGRRQIRRRRSTRRKSGNRSK